MADIFSRTELLLGRAGMEKLENARVAVFGIGGVGGYAAEALARSGVGALDLIDNDRVASTNLNRQIIALQSTVGKLKTEVAGERSLDINPACVVRKYERFFLPENAGEFPFGEYDYVVDAIDTVTGKIGIVKACEAAGVPVISCMGAGNKLDASAFEVTDIYRTKICPLAKVMRRLCRENGIEKLKVVYSREVPMSLMNAEEMAEKEGVYKPRVPGSIAFVPSVAGLIAAGEVVKDLTGVYGNGIDRS